MITTLKPRVSSISSFLTQLTLRRTITISQSSTSSTESTKTTTESTNIQDVEELVGYRTLETAEFKALGNPQTILSINSPPSVPIYVRRGSLLSIYGLQEISSISSVRSTLEFPKWFKKLIYGGFVSSYQKLISTTPFSILVTSISRTSGSSGSGQKSFVCLSLDGTNDWAVLNRSAIQIYTGNSLNLDMHPLPRTISRKLSQKLNISGRTPTGLNSWKQLGYCLINGRGQVGLVGNGSVYNINLDDGEEILINKKNLLAITVNGSNDLQNCIVKYSFPVDEQVIEEVETPAPVKSTSSSTQWGKISNQLYHIQKYISNFFGTIANYTNWGKSKTYNILVGNQEFIKIIGPRNILLQSNTITGPSRQRLYNRSAKSTAPPPGEFLQPQPTAESQPVDKTSSDYLNYVTIKPGKGAVFKSTPDFSESVKQIESSSKK
ncbi:AIM24 [[Candida] subhashii]|uniref:Altered inheritance of mitochondria protein 24, mitochondrial n=1 Tax=[Candida] subhashii TaxID=561895 RepID=A0A8J5QEH8_9ASCO|nr:AIM24 [[Candida] subhashii]KAG7660532.1 AIM24 [[Candida] subhashii]